MNFGSVAGIGLYSGSDSGIGLNLGSGAGIGLNSGSVAGMGLGLLDSGRRDLRFGVYMSLGFECLSHYA